MAYRIQIKASAQKDLAALPISARKRADAAILLLADNPRPPGCRKLQGAEDLYRTKVGDYRVIYSIQDDILLIVVVRVRHRKDAYVGLV